MEAPLGVWGMNFIKRYIGDLYISKVWYLLMGGCVVLLFLSFFVHFLFQPVVACSVALLFFTLTDYVLLFIVAGDIRATRIISPRFSIGDDNPVTLSVSNSFPFRIKGILTDELPFQFQERNFRMPVTIGYKAGKTVSYSLRPLSRGEYGFGYLICFAEALWGYCADGLIWQSQ